MVIVCRPPNHLEKNQEHKVFNPLFQQFIAQWLYNQSAEIKGQPISNQQVLG
ncbi:uncharacterized protein METZ01_LOCUS500653, partial [marine metagenome]